MVELQRGLHKTILMVTHDPRAAVRAERVLHLDKGQLVNDVPTLGRDRVLEGHHDRIR
jgi:putative ABC transport system ATP-binding protein